jgi:CDP-glycerol glycerophosphotransferase (TagB/SpsB family)
MQLLAVADYVITDYSAISLEAAVLDKKTLFWVYDYEEYIKNNGLNIDLFEAAPGHVSRDIKDIMKVIDDGSYDMSVLERFRQTYLPDELGTSTKKITDMILHIIKTGNLPEKR